MKKEISAMAIVLCQNKILTTHELIYGNLKVSVPKGHIEKGETVIEAAIRETFEEANVMITKADFIAKLTEFEINFMTPQSKEINKTIFPLLFRVKDMGNPLAKEKGIQKVEYVEINEFLEICSYENVRAIVNEAIKIDLEKSGK